MTSVRPVRRVSKSQPIEEGGGVRLHRAFGGREDARLFDPFLLLDDFRGDKPEDYEAGFPSHPHRGIETVTYVLRGEVEHEDSTGRRGLVSAGGIQWMTAGSGIIHQEMPRGDAQGVLWGFQLWANLPSDRKMMAPRYGDYPSAEIPVVNMAGDALVRLISGRIDGIRGPLREIVIGPEILDVIVPVESEFIHPTMRGHTVFAYIFEGKGLFGPAAASLSGEAAASDSGAARVFIPAENRHLLLFDDGDRVMVRTEGTPVRFLLVSGPPLGEPIAWRGSVVMNTGDEVRTAYDEIRAGTFVK